MVLRYSDHLDASPLKTTLGIFPRLFGLITNLGCTIIQARMVVVDWPDWPEEEPYDRHGDEDNTGREIQELSIGGLGNFL